MTFIREIAAGWFGGAVMVLALLSTIAWQGVPEVEETDGRQPVLLDASRRLARFWLPLVAAACLLTVLRIVLY